MKDKIAPLEQALRKITDEMNAAIAIASPKLRPRLEASRELVGNALVQLELVSLMTDAEAPKK